MRALGEENRVKALQITVLVREVCSPGAKVKAVEFTATGGVVSVELHKR